MLQKFLSLFSAKKAIPDLAPLNTIDFLSDLFARHGIESTTYGDWIVPRNELPSLRANWYPGQSSGVLQVDTLVREGVLIEECFAGIGDGETGLKDALINFTINSFHVLLAALWDQNDTHQVSTENWDISGKRYTVYIGNFGTRGTEGITPDIPYDLLAEIEKVIKLESLAGDVHWFRFYFGYIAGDRTIEALKDNEIWDAGMRCLEDVKWPESDEFYSVRLFIVLREV